MEGQINMLEICHGHMLTCVAYYNESENINITTLFCQSFIPKWFQIFLAGIKLYILSPGYSLVVIWNIQRTRRPAYAHKKIYSLETYHLNSPSPRVLEEHSIYMWMMVKWRACTSSRESFWCRLCCSRVKSNATALTVSGQRQQGKGGVRMSSRATNRE